MVRAYRCAQYALAQTLLRKAGHVFHTSAERETVRELKEAVCQVSAVAESDRSLSSMVTGNPGRGVPYKLPDGTVIDVRCGAAAQAF